MNAITTRNEFSEINPRAVSISSDETYWGYIIRCRNNDRTMAILMQWTAAVVGAVLLIAAFGIWTLPGSMTSQDVVGFKLGFSTIMAVVGVALVWFASHGTHYEVQVDLARLELREVLRNSRGTARIQDWIKFEDIDAVYIDRSAGEKAKARLMVRLAASSKAIEVGKDFEENLTHLHLRLGRDVLGMIIEKPVKANRGF
ncbi:hypothetical protein JI58_10015 [Marinosulfonomonas sp. PRT-SC04]|nr:hypothetical protein JI58_10015 [Marinosulfonomonas sp. PRT-SC04]